MESEAESSKIADVPQRIRLLISAAKILPASHRNEAERLLDRSLVVLKEWGAEDKSSSRQRIVTSWRTEVLAQYAMLNPEKALALQQELQTSTQTGGNNVTANKDDNWYFHFKSGRMMADRSAKIALTLVDTNTEKATNLVAESLQEGVVSRQLFDIVEKLHGSGNRALLNSIETVIGQSLAGKVAIDPLSLQYTAVVVSADPEMSPTNRNVLIGFLMRSLQSWVSLVRNEAGTAWIDTEYISTTFSAFYVNVRPLLLQYSASQLLTFDFVLDQVAPLVPDKTKAVLHSMMTPEPTTTPRERLANILREQATEIRDLRLLRLAIECLEKGGDGYDLDLASDTIGVVNDSALRTVLSDALSIRRMNLLVKEDNLVAASRIAAAISSLETRAWAALALSRVVPKKDTVTKFELTRAALNALEGVSPSPKKVELALMAASILAKDDAQLAFEALSAATKYANSSPAKTEYRDGDLGRAINLEATVGGLTTKLGAAPESLSELDIDPSLSLLGITDWFRASQTVNEIKEPTLRLQLKLRFAGAVISNAPKKSSPKQSF